MNEIIAMNNYTQFHCKCGDCRNTCCKLWHITLSEDEYFKTESLDCSDSLKEIINRSLSLIPSHLASQNKYAEINLKYDGYISRQLKQVAQYKKLEKKLIPADIDYDAVGSLRTEARQKLKEIRPVSIGQASRISGVSPADISVLLIYLKR